MKCSDPCWMHKLRLVSTSVLFVTAFAAGAALLSQSVPARDRVPDPQSDRQSPLAASPLMRARVRPRAGCSSWAGCSTRPAIQ